MKEAQARTLRYVMGPPKHTFAESLVFGPQPQVTVFVGARCKHSLIALKA